MFFQHNDEIEFVFPDAESRPFNRATFMLQGIAVTWDTAPTTSENLGLILVVEDPHDSEVEHEFPLRNDVDPSAETLTSWTYTIAGGPIALPRTERVKFVYPNTDSRLVKVKFIGYYTNG